MDNILNKYFFVLFSLIPISIILGPSISLSNILLIDFSFIFLLLYKKDYRFLSNKSVRLILLLYLYLIFNSLISKDFFLSSARNFGFIRFVILFCAFNYFFYNRDFFIKVFTIWTIILTILILDTYIESIFGKNSLGYGGGEFGNRIVSFFKDEPIVGGYISSFYLIIVGYFFTISKEYPQKYKNIIVIISIFFLVAIFLTGERSNSIKALVAFLIFYSINDLFKLKYKIISIASLLALIVLLFTSSNFLKNRYYNIYHQFSNNETSEIHKLFVMSEEKKRMYFLDNNLYVKIYKSGIKVFKQNPFFGVGNKNYRIACENKSFDKRYNCTTHPHQVYFEFLAEHGIIGSIVLLSILLHLIFTNLRIIILSKNLIQVGAFAYLIINFLPFLPSGSFFSDYTLTLFWINLSLMYSIEKKTNIYSSK